MKGKILKKISLWLPPAVWAALIFHFSSGKVFVASTIYWRDFTVKKIGHVLLFGFLSILLYRALRGEEISGKKALIWAVIISIIYGVTDEYHQLFTQGREGRVRDIFIDGAGAFLTTYLIYRFLPRVPKKIKIYFEKLNLI